MKTLKHIASLPASGVEVITEGTLTRIFFDFTDPEQPASEEEMKQPELPSDLKACENVDVEGRSYAGIVSAIINDRYSQDDTQALHANYQMAKDAESEISDEKRSEYLAEYAAFQNWRIHAKEIAATVVAILSE